MMNCRKLIELIRQREELYVTSHSSYSDGDIKEELWKEISHEVNAPG